MEALSAQPGRKSTRQLVDWFWRETVAARAFVALRDICLKSEDDGMRYLGIRSLVPRSQEHLLKSPPGSSRLPPTAAPPRFPAAGAPPGPPGRPPPATRTASGPPQ